MVEDRPPEEVPNAATAKSKYGFQQISKRKEERLAELQEAAPVEGARNLPILRHGDHEFFECPVPTVTEGLMSSPDRFANFVINIVNWSEATGTMPDAGGLLDQSNVFYEARMVVLSEQGRIEREKQDEMKRDMEKKNKTPKSRGAGSSLGRRSSG